MSRMTPRDLVYRTLRFQPASRIPRQMWTLPWAGLHYPDELAAIQRDFPDDIVPAPVRRPTLPWMEGDFHSVGQFIDEWGCRFTNICAGLIGEVKEPLIGSYESDLGKLRPPDEYIGMVDGINEACTGERFVIGCPGVNPFERMQWIRGTENLMLDLAERPAGFFRLLRCVHEWDLAIIESWCRTGIDAISWNDDWGAQQSLLISPAMWREIFKPLYRQYVEIAHRAGKFAFMHSDGWIFDIYGDLIEIGVDAINSQLFCMDIEEIGRRFKGRITFWGEIDRQHILAHEPPEAAREAVRRVARALRDGRGGVIAQCEFGAGARPENVRAVFDEWNRVTPG